MAIGKYAVSAKTFLERRYHDDLEMEDAIHTMEETNIEVGIIKDDKKFHIITPAEVKDYLEQAE
ncbi:hypothetical protein PsorP6_009819 [Peronosclerospora sorghi]|uniref:Uncharacterized protein n=1 Tax=Peronosclerospora sorghi TaxID=230839 RepID=A0ACC0VZI1_9STRA|nr:hypothetical protein PsorP6_009819 [Peronosclerospora sorghi]